ncbi:lipid phosphate phosphatase 2-like isoform X2 [Miscanthus floridulus]|uniref:lipid phosphate phosphatase 2-like isoform X2 n=1 Tax=Miscanthus floridulus TaxID=154761 RepID=UPI00345A6C2C
MPPPPATPASGAATAMRPYLRTHGKQVARLHLFDWAVLLLLVAMYAVLGLLQPFHRFVAEDMMASLRYPMKDNTVPSWAVPIIAIVVPMIFIVGIYIKRRNVYDLHHAILGLLFSVLITAILTVSIKDAVGRPRPDFFWLCFPDGVPYNNITGGVICHRQRSVIEEGHKSFPSGHSSGCFAGLGFLSWYLADKIKAFDRRGHVAKLCIVLLPLLLATMVAVSRVSDYWHHWQDVFAGRVLGLVVASFCYLQFFPPPYSKHGVWPHAYFEHIHQTEGERNIQSTTNANLHHQSLTLDLSGSNVIRTPSHALDSMEEGSRAQ